MSSFAAGNLIRKEHKDWVIENMETGSYLLDLNEDWLCYLTKRDTALGDRLLTSPDSMVGVFSNIVNLFEPQKPLQKRALEIPASVAAISRKAPVFYLNHPEDHGWVYCAIDRGEILGHLALEYEMNRCADENGLNALSTFGFSEETVQCLRNALPTPNDDIEALFIFAETLTEALNCSIDFTSHHYVDDDQEGYTILASR